MNNKDTTLLTNINDYIKIGIDNPFILSNFLKSETIDGNTFDVFNLFKEKYYELLDSEKVYVKLDEDAYRKYKYRPKLLSYDLYGTIDLWYILMIINDCNSICNFNKEYLYILKQNDINNIITKLIEIKNKKY